MNDPAPPMATEAAPRARARAYGVLSRLVLHGLDEAMVRLVDEVAVLRAAIPLGADPDELAAEHHALFSMQVFPYESVYLDPEGQPGGEVSRRVADVYRQAGFGVKVGDVTADHLGVELAFLSFLSSVEADALRDGHAAAVTRARDLSRAFLGDHLARGLAPFVAAAADVTPSFWTVVVELVVELVAEHRRELGPTSERTMDPTTDAEDLLDDPETDIRRIAAYLCEPARSGVLITRGDIERVGRRLTLPTGFGSRAQRMQCLIESAAQYESLPALCEALDASVAARREHYRTLEDLGTAWRRRASVTQNLLRRLAEAAPAASTQEAR